MCFSIWRLVVPCLLSNTVAGIQGDRVFGRVFQIKSLLFQTPFLQSQLNMEIGVLVEHFDIYLLQLQPQLGRYKAVDDLGETDDKNYYDAKMNGSVTKPLHEQQLHLLFEFRRWFTVNCGDVVKSFLNFDTDIATQFEGPNQLMHGTQWKLY